MLAVMGELLRKRLVSSRFEGVHQEAVLNLLVAHSHVRGILDGVFAGMDLTTTQYNVLRILNGAYPDGYPRGEIARRMVERSPDLTRLIDRLVVRGLVERRRSREDARKSIARITARGRRMLASMHPLVRHATLDAAKCLTEREAAEFSRLCEKLYADEM